MPYQLLGIIFFLSYFNLADPLKCHSQHTNAYPLPEHKKTECVGEKCWILKNAQTKQVSRDCMWGFQFKIGCDLLEITKDNVTTQYFLCFCNNTNNCNSELPTFDTTKNEAKLGGKQIPLRKIGAEELKCYDFLDTQIYSNDGVMPFLKPLPSWPVAGMKPKTMQKASSCGLRVRELLKNETKTEVMMWDHTFELYNFAPSLHGDEWPMYDGLAITKQFSWDYRLTQQFCLTDRCNALTTSLASYENSVECLAIDGKRCRGQACFFGFYSKIDVDWTNAVARYEVGFYSPMDGIHMYVCAEDLCNRDEAAALESVQTCYPNYPPLQKPGVETWADVEKALATGLYSFNCNGPTTDPTTTMNLPSELMTTTETPGVESGTSGPTETAMEGADACWIMKNSLTKQVSRDCSLGYKFEPGCTLRDVLADDSTTGQYFICFCNHTNDCNKDIPTFDTRANLATLGGKQVPLRKLALAEFHCYDFNNQWYEDGKYTVWGWPIEPELFNFVPTLYGQLAPLYDGLVYAIQERCNQLTTNRGFYENGITCLVEGTKSCVGQACIFIVYEKLNKDERDVVAQSGCFSQDWTNSDAQYKIGMYMPSHNVRMYICAEDNCNQDEDTAKASIQNCEPKYPPVKGPGVETWYDVEKALTTGEYSLNCKGPTATALTTGIAPTQNSIPETTTKSVSRDCSTNFQFEPGCTLREIQAGDGTASQYFICFCNHATDCNKDLPTFDAKKGLATMGGAQIPLRKLGAKQFRCFQFNNAVDYPQGGQPPFLKPQPMWDVNFTASPTLVKQSACGLEIEESYKEPEEKIIIGRNSDPELFNLVPSLYGQLIPTYDGLVYAVQFYWDERYWQKFCLNDFCNQLTTNPAFYENGITCLVDETKQCVGQACIFILYEKIDKTEQDIIVISGCFSQDWTESVAQYKVGYYSPTKNIRMYICAEDNCNQDENRAKASIQNCQPYYPPAKGPGVETWYDVQKALAAGEYSLNCKGSSTQNPIETTTKGAESTPSNPFPGQQRIMITRFSICFTAFLFSILINQLESLKCISYHINIPSPLANKNKTECEGEMCWILRDNSGQKQISRDCITGYEYEIGCHRFEIVDHHTDHCNENYPTFDTKKNTSKLAGTAVPLWNYGIDEFSCYDFSFYDTSYIPEMSNSSWALKKTVSKKLKKSSGCTLSGNEDRLDNTSFTVQVWSELGMPFHFAATLDSFDVFPYYAGGLYAYQRTQQNRAFGKYCLSDKCNLLASNAAMYEKAVKCLLPMEGEDTTCMGQACYYIYYKTIMDGEDYPVSMYGCFSQDWTTATGQYKIGYYSQITGIRLYLCAEDMMSIMQRRGTAAYLRIGQWQKDNIELATTAR
ncbi:unnamed protein product, partial [Mesorhabditis spiculigera]